MKKMFNAVLATELIHRVDVITQRHCSAALALHSARFNHREALSRRGAIKKALVVIQDSATQMQNQLKDKIVNMVNMALRSVFDSPPLFIMDIVSKRNKVECELSLQEGKYPCSPEDGAGGGVLDVVSFALRVVVWTFTNNENTLILDEPFKFLSADRAEKASMMLHEISHRLNLQIIMVSHQEGINTVAGSTYMVSRINDSPSIATKL